MYMIYTVHRFDTFAMTWTSFYDFNIILQNIRFPFKNYDIPLNGRDCLFPACINYHNIAYISM